MTGAVEQREIVSHSIVQLCPEDRALRAAVVQLHLAEIPYGDMAVFGAGVLGGFYHGELLADPDFIDVAYLVDGEVAGFASFSRDFVSVRRRAIGRRWPSLAISLAVSCARDPRRVVRLLGLLRTAAGGRGAVQPRAEALSLAVAPRFRTAEFFRRTGLRLGRDLYVHIGRTLYRLGERRVSGTTRAGNVLAAATLRSLGWHVVRPVNDGHDIEWVWDLAEVAVRCGFDDDHPAIPAVAVDDLLYR